MFIRYNDILCLNDWNDVIEIKYDNVIIGFETTLELKKDEIIYTSDKDVKNIPINSDDLILMTANHFGAGVGAETNSAIYVQIANGTSLIFGCSIPDPVQDIKNSDLYKMNCYITKRISEYYNIPWEFRDKIDSAEKPKPNKVLRVLLIIFLVSMILKLVLDFI